MELLYRHHRPDPPPRPSASHPGIPVLLSPGLAELAPALARALGPAFDGTTEHLGDRGVMLTGPVGPAGVAFLRASYPRVGLLIVDRRWTGRRTGEIVINLEAGADGYLTGPTLAEVASHVQALARRRFAEFAPPITAA